MVFRKCIVPNCGNTSQNPRNKRFIRVPSEEPLRGSWFTALQIDASQYSPDANLFVCEDHFDLPKDVENYTDWMNGKRIKLRDGVIPRGPPPPPGKRKGETSTDTTTAKRANFEELDGLAAVLYQSIISQVQETTTESEDSGTTEVIQSGNSEKQHSTVDQSHQLIEGVIQSENSRPETINVVDVDEYSGTNQDTDDVQSKNSEVKLTTGDETKSAHTPIQEKYPDPEEPSTLDESSNVDEQKSHDESTESGYSETEPGTLEEPDGLDLSNEVMKPENSETRSNTVEGRDGPIQSFEVVQGIQSTGVIQTPPGLPTGVVRPNDFSNDGENQESPASPTEQTQSTRYVPPLCPCFTSAANRGKEFIVCTCKQRTNGKIIEEDGDNPKASTSAQ